MQEVPDVKSCRHAMCAEEAKYQTLTASCAAAARLGRVGGTSSRHEQASHLPSMLSCMLAVQMPVAKSNSSCVSRCIGTMKSM